MPLGYPCSSTHTKNERTWALRICDQPELTRPWTTAGPANHQSIMSILLNKEKRQLRNLFSSKWGSQNVSHKKESQTQNMIRNRMLHPFTAKPSRMGLTIELLVNYRNAHQLIDVIYMYI
jgi:hypothetical protein